MRARCAIIDLGARINFPAPTGVVGWLVTLCVAMLTMWPAQIGVILGTCREVVEPGVITLCQMVAWERVHGAASLPICVRVPACAGECCE